MAGYTPLAAMVVAAVLLSPPADAAGKPSCKECADWEMCREDLIRQKKALRAVYEQLAARWEIAFVDTSVEGSRTPLDVVDLLTVEEVSWPKLLANLRLHFDNFAQAEEAATREVPPPRFCGLGSSPIEMATDSNNCVVEGEKAMHAKQTLPCREIYDIALGHEGLHVSQCLKRKGKRPRTSKLLTPAGRAREEVQAYTQEIEELQKVKGPKPWAPGPVREDRPLKGPRFCFPVVE